MSAGVTIQSARRTGTVLVPLEAVPFPENQGTVQVLDAAGKPQAKRVVLGLRNDTQAEVVDGLKSGDKVVVADPPGKRRTINVGGPN